MNYIKIKEPPPKKKYDWCCQPIVKRKGKKEINNKSFFKIIIISNFSLFKVFLNRFIIISHFSLIHLFLYKNKLILG